MLFCLLILNVFCLDPSLPNRNFQFSFASLSLVPDNSLNHELRVIAALKRHLHATYYAQHPALKSVDDKSQLVVGGKLFSSYRTLFQLAQGLRYSKTSDLNCSYVALVQKEALIRYLHLYAFYHYHQF